MVVYYGGGVVIVKQDVLVRFLIHWKLAQYVLQFNQTYICCTLTKFVIL